MTDQRIGRYQILDLIGEGGQGVVYRVFDPHTGGILAVKELLPSTGDPIKDRVYLDRFHREAHLASSIDHPNIVKIFEVGEDNGRHYMALEFLPEDLASIIGSAGALPVDRAVTFAIQIAHGLHEAHDRDIVHRDVKPANVLIATDGIAKLTDFGIARSEKLSNITKTGVLIGTERYMSPEQYSGERVDLRSDLYSLGVVLYEMLTGSVRFGARPLREQRGEVGQELASVVERALEVRPERRFQSALDMASALEITVRHRTEDVAKLRQTYRHLYKRLHTSLANLDGILLEENLIPYHPETLRVEIDEMQKKLINGDPLELQLKALPSMRQPGTGQASVAKEQAVRKASSKRMSPERPLRIAPPLQSYSEKQMAEDCRTCFVAGFVVPFLIIATLTLNDFFDFIYIPLDAWFMMLIPSSVAFFILHFIPRKWISLGIINAPIVTDDVYPEKTYKLEDGNIILEEQGVKLTRHKCYLGERISVFDWLSTGINGLIGVCVFSPLLHLLWKGILPFIWELVTIMGS